MQNLMNDPIHRNADRRRKESRTKREQEQRKRVRKKEILSVIKILLLWVLCFVAVTVFVIAMEAVLSHRAVLKWFLIFTFTYVLVYQIDFITRKIKKSPRNGNSKRDKLNNSL